MKRNPYRKRAAELEDQLRDIREQITDVIGDEDDEDDDDRDNPDEPEPRRNSR